MTIEEKLLKLLEEKSLIRIGDNDFEIKGANIGVSIETYDWKNITHYYIQFHNDYLIDVEDKSELYKIIQKKINEVQNKEDEEFIQEQEKEVNEYLDKLLESQ